MAAVARNRPLRKPDPAAVLSRTTPLWSSHWFSHAHGSSSMAREWQPNPAPDIRQTSERLGPAWKPVHGRSTATGRPSVGVVLWEGPRRTSPAAFRASPTGAAGLRECRSP